MMLSYLSRSPGTGGLLKASPQDFLVEEIAPDGAIYELNKQFSRPDEEGGYVHFILQKKNWTTSSAISEIANNVRISQKNFNIAGSKDKTAISTQAASVYGASKESVLGLKIKDISINGAWTAKERIRLGSLLGNRFTIFVRDAEPNPDETISRISEELEKKFPNYFGEQRFGSSRRNTHIIGQKLLANQIEDAVLLFLCGIENEKNEAVRAARKKLYDTRDFTLALREFPKHLRLERSMISYLAKNPDSYANALRKLPRNILLLFIHAAQSDLFNRLLSERISEGEIELEEGEFFCGETLGFPDTSKMEAEGWICGKLIGYGTPLNERERNLLEELGVSKDSFRMKAIPEISSKGSYRTIFSPLKDFNYGNAVFRFSLAAGSYATVAMREFMEKKS